jgi:hypothetical protein
MMTLAAPMNRRNGAATGGGVLSIGLLRVLVVLVVMSRACFTPPTFGVAGAVRATSVEISASPLSLVSRLRSDTSSDASRHFFF